MRKEELELLPIAERVLSAADWRAIERAFATNLDPIAELQERDYERLFSRASPTSRRRPSGSARRGDDRRRKLMYKHILIPTDGSEVAHKGVAAGIDYAREVGAKGRCSPRCRPTSRPAKATSCPTPK